MRIRLKENWPLSTYRGLEFTSDQNGIFHVGGITFDMHCVSLLEKVNLAEIVEEKKTLQKKLKEQADFYDIKGPFNGTLSEFLIHVEQIAREHFLGVFPEQTFHWSDPYINGFNDAIDACVKAVKEG